MPISNRFEISLILLAFSLWATPHSAAADGADGAPGTLAVGTEPRSANVYVDGRFYGMTPVEIELEPGPHDLRILLEGFMVVERRVDISGGERIEVSATLEPAAILLAKSVPGGADILVDGEKVGTTPAEVPVLPGVRVVSVVKEGHESWANKMWFDAGEKRWVNAELPYKFGRLEVHSIPKGAEVFLNNEHRGTADPLLFEQLTPGVYDLRLALPTYDDRVKEILIERGETLSIVERLTHTSVYLEQERRRREVRNAKIRKAVRITSVGVGVAAAVYAGVLHGGVKDRE